ncbi:DNA repair protein SMC6 LALA0_S01e10682g [Lachancea lanzarotensis]|uniref:LALA0S01e10682g1_1 n=1 Tax=Lachancea lanzarotensis TaxID=1245769 RepID=A0A0C7MT04_9SACH|nr:uncharacterized protein LALA0_S01e10682g [Lachancea lanzarotensis]CEP60429.1 LALA0S01e10682g1_1 [Lachancea lanzarotensis]
MALVGLGESLNARKRPRTSSSFDGDSFPTQLVTPTGTGGTKKRARNYAPMTQTQRSQQVDGTDGSSMSSWHFPGYIKRVKLRNFMCHENFHLELGSKLNFIVGSNGSGKSAILTAITIGLGAKATDTNRGTNLKEFIREGCSTARVEIVLNNEGFGVYDPETYGTEITIIRTIKKDGAATFAIRGDHGVVSTKRRDLQTIADYFAIPVMNPMCFLSQDAARSFLTASTPADKYKHFMRGTLIEDIEANLHQAVETATKAQDHLLFHAKNVKLLRQEYQDSRRLMKELHASRDLGRRKKVLQGKLLWLSVVENEDSLQKLGQNYNEFQDKIIELQMKKTQTENKIERYTSDQSASEEALLKAQTKLQDDKQLFEDVRSKMNQMKLEYEVHKRNRSETNAMVDEARTKIDHCAASIANLEEQLRRQTGGDKEGIKQEMNSLTVEISVANEKLAHYNKSLRVMNEEEEDLKSAQEKDLLDRKKSIYSKKKELNGYVAGKQNFLSNFDPKMDQVVREMKRREHHFSTPPIGPLGAYLTVKAEFREWAKCIQAYLGNSLGAFIVSNAKDNQILREIFRAHLPQRKHPSIITRRPTTFDYSGGRPKVNHPTIIDALEFSEGTQFVLVDFNNIEKVLLIKDKTEARNLLYSPRNTNAKRALSWVKADRFVNFLSATSVNSLQYEGPLKMMTQSSSEDDIALLKSLIIEEERQLNEVVQQNDCVLRERRKQKSEIEAKISSLRSLTSELSRREGALRIELEREIDMGAIEQIQVEKRTYEDAISSYLLTVTDINAKLEAISERAQNLRRDLSESKAQVETSENSLKDLKSFCAQRNSKLSKLREDVPSYTQQIHEYVQKSKETEKAQEEFRVGIERQISNATLFCPRETAFGSGMPSTKDETNTEIERISRQIQNAEHRVGLAQDQVLELFEKAKLKYEDAEKKYVEVDRVIICLNESLRKRLQSFDLARSDTCFTADVDFKESLQRRNFSGGLSYDFDKKVLNMFMKTPNDNSPRNVDTFSGGEKSFAQTSLLLATWRPMRSRVIALDEFDVFMDQVNRQIGTKLIISKYSSDERTQTIIITPQDIGKIADLDDPGICIHKMNDPERRRG